MFLQCMDEMDEGFVYYYITHMGYHGVDHYVSDVLQFTTYYYEYQYTLYTFVLAHAFCKFEQT